MKNKLTFTDEFGIIRHLDFVEHRYMNNNLAIQAIDCDTDEPYCMVSINIDKLPDNEFCYDLNNNGEKLYKSMIQHGFIEHTGGYCFSGFCVYPVCKWKGE